MESRKRCSDSGATSAKKSCHVMSSQCTTVGETSDLWIEFDPFAVISDSSDMSSSEILMDCDSDSDHILTDCDSDSDDTSEILNDCDSDSDDTSEILNDCDSDSEYADEFGASSGLFFLNVAVQSNVHNPSFISRTSLCERLLVIDDVGTCKIREVNKRWKEMTSHVDGRPRLPQRVTFAPEKNLVAVCPVDMIDRKSEWEQFAVERFRFKRRAEEFEKIINPYFAPVHREKVCQRMRAAYS